MKNLRSDKSGSIVFISFVLSFIFIANSFALQQNLNRNSHLKAKTELSLRPYFIDSQKRISSKTGQVFAWYNLNVITGKSDAVEGAKSFLQSHAFDFADDSAINGLKLLVVKESPAGQNVHFQQHNQDIPVYRAFYNVTLDKENSVRMVIANGYSNFLLPDNSPGISSNEAIQTARKVLNGDGPELAEPFAVLNGYRDEYDKDHLVWLVKIVSMDPMGDWDIIIDALNGEFLEVVDHMMYTDGQGMVFDPDPVTTANVNYGGNYSDNNDQDNTSLNAERVSVVLQDIELNNGVYRLYGPHVQIRDFESPNGAPVTNADPDDFNYTRSEQGFEDVMVYYHIDMFQRHIQELGFDDIQNTSIWADPHGLNGDDNSHFIPSLNRLAFGEGGVDDAEDSDVIWHEYGHAIQHGASPSWTGGHTADLGEGLSDYWAGTMSQRLETFHDTWVFNWDGHNEFWNGRNLTSGSTYNNWIPGSIYTNGSIYSACLWDMHEDEDMDVDDLDAIVLQHNTFLSNGATAEDAAEALMLAEELLFGGQYAMIVAQNLYDRHFIDEIPVFGSISGSVIDQATSLPLENAEISLGALPSVYTNPMGEFEMTDLQIGMYSLSVSLEGYLTHVEEVEILQDQNIEVTIELFQPQISANTNQLNINMEIESVLDTFITVSNSGDDIYFDVELHPENVPAVERWTQESTFPVSDIVDDNMLMGVTYFDGNFYVTGAHNNTNPNKIYIISPTTGELVDEINQPGNTTWGYFDLATDGEFLYAGAGSTIDKFDADFNLIESFLTPLDLVRGLAYDPDNDWFWCVDNMSDIYAVDRNGDQQSVISNESLHIIGLAFDAYAPEGYTLIISSMDGNGSRASISRANPLTGDIEYVGHIAEDVENATSTGFDCVTGLPGYENYSVCPVIISDITSSFAEIRVYSLASTMKYLDVSPKHSTIPGNDDLDVSFNFNTSGMTAGDYSGSVKMIRSDVGVLLDIAVNLHVTDISVNKEYGLPLSFEVGQAYPNPFNPSTSFSISLPQNGDIQFAVFDLLGRKVQEQNIAGLSAGIHQINWNTDGDFASGLYFMKFNYNGLVETRKALLIK